MSPTNEVTPQPGRVARLVRVLTFPAGIVVGAARYLWWSGEVRRSTTPGDRSDLPSALPEELVDERVKRLEDGSGPLLHRHFRVAVRGPEVDASGLVDRLTGDLDQAAPSEVVNFRKTRGSVGSCEVGDEYLVRIPAPWDGPVRVIHRTPTSFRFATLQGHLEAGQIEFRAEDHDDALVFEIETWSRPGDRLAAVLFDRLLVGKEVQLHMWFHFCLSAVTMSGGRRVGPVAADTRRADWPVRD